MELTAQIPDVTVGRAANAPHYEYMTTFGKRTAELPVDHELWRKGKDEFDTAFKADKLRGIVEITAHVGDQTLNYIPYYSWDNREAGKMKVWVPLAD